MAVQITWSPNTEDDIASYELERSTDGILFTALVTITHDLSDPSVFNVPDQIFFFDDATGVANLHFYRLRAVDSAGNKSAFTAPKQVGPPDPAICVVFGTIVNPDGTPNTDIEIKATVVSEKDSKDGQIVGGLGVTGKQVEAFTDDNGFFEIPLIQGSMVNLSIPKIELEREVQIPAKEVIDFNELL